MKPRDRVSMAITVPSVMVLAPPKPKLCMPDRPAHAPRTAVMTYSRYPELFTIGMVMLP